MLMAVIPVYHYEIARKQIGAIQNHVDGVELRLDYLKSFDWNIVAALRQEFTLPMIFTLRKKSQGGCYEGSEKQRLKDILKLCELGPHYLDLEWDTPQGFLEIIKLQYPSIQLIGSYHHFKKTPKDLEKILEINFQHAYFDFYKIATLAKNTLDALRILKFSKKFNKKYKLTTIGMGEAGQCTRILSPILGNAMHYASVDDSSVTASGQLSVYELLNIYHFRKLNSFTKIYALLGDPIQPSLGYLLHNPVIEYLNQNAVYIKLKSSSKELPSILKACRDSGFKGLSITMPLKEFIVPLLDQIQYSAQSIQAINSVVFQRKKYIGFNTDGLGCLKALFLNCPKIFPLKDKTIVILGAGGAARAIAYAIHQQKAPIIIVNRTLEKAKKLALEVEGESYTFKNMPSLMHLKCNVLINTLPTGAYSEKSIQSLLDPTRIHPLTIAMDIVYQPLQTPFLKLAHKAQCKCISGDQMYIEQALLQIKRWFRVSDIKMKELRRIMQRFF